MNWKGRRPGAFALALAVIVAALVLSAGGLSSRAATGNLAAQLQSIRALIVAAISSEDMAVYAVERGYRDGAFNELDRAHSSLASAISGVTHSDLAGEDAGPIAR